MCPPFTPSPLYLSTLLYLSLSLSLISYQLITLNEYPLLFSGAAAAQPPTLVQAKSLALTALEIMKPGNAEVLANIKKDFALQMAETKA